MGWGAQDPMRGVRSRVPVEMRVSLAPEMKALKVDAGRSASVTEGRAPSGMEERMGSGVGAGVEAMGVGSAGGSDAAVTSASTSTPPVTSLTTSLVVDPTAAASTLA